MTNERLFTTTTNSTSPQGGFLRLPDVLRLIPVGKSTWWEGVRSGRFPASVKLGPRITAWHSDDIRRCIAELKSRDRT